MSILDTIVADKIKEVTLRKSLFPQSFWEKSPLFERQTHSLCKRLKNSRSGIIAEHKRRSPSRDNINQSLTVSEVALGYEKAGACGLSVLTDLKYFGGSLEDLSAARAVTQLPLLRKEFIVDPYQIIEAKANGADVILLIAACLKKQQIQSFTVLAQSLGMEILLEVHNRTELEKNLIPEVDLLGVNNRNLKTFEVSLDTSKSLAALIPDNMLKVSESGISSPEAITDLKGYGYSGFLVGENFMKTDNPGAAARAFINTLEQ